MNDKPCPICGREMTAIETYAGRGELYCGHCDLTIGGNEAKTPGELQALMNNSKKRKKPMTVSDLLEVMRYEDVWVYRGNKELYHGQCEGIKQHVRVRTVSALYVGRNKELVIEVSE